MDYSNHAELSTPFIAVPVPDEPETDTRPQTPTKLPEENHECCSSRMELLQGLEFALLIFLQFAIFYSDDHLEGLQWSVVNASIFLFLLAGHLFHVAVGALTDSALLIPEMMIVICMGTACFYSVYVAFLCLIAGMFLLSSTVVVVNIYQLCYFNSEEDESEDETDKESMV